MTPLIQLAQDLEWQVLDLRSLHSEDADESLQEPQEQVIQEQQRTVMATADKIQRELLATVRFDPLRLVGVGGPIAATLDAVADLLLAVDEIREDAATDVGSLPSAVRSFQGLLKGFCEEPRPVAA